ncbi:MAG: MBL fold metallo-hydrolase [Anaerolineaceae bacterium]|nr:MBL fold metallo-hydrolase [Anaerolineaceae bacterium]
MQNNFHRIHLGISNVYLLSCSQGYLLIDTGYKNQYTRFLRHLTNLGVEPTHIRYLLLTHHHHDHAGFTAQLTLQSGAKVICHQAALAHLQRGSSAETMQPVNRRTRVLLSLFGLIHRDSTYPPYEFKTGDITVAADDAKLLRCLGIEGEIVFTPGHCSDSISVLLDDGSAFVGDSAMNFLQMAGIHHRPIYIEDIDAVFESWQKLIAKGAKMIYPTHGSPYPVESLAQSLSRFTGSSV